MGSSLSTGKNAPPLDDFILHDFTKKDELNKWCFTTDKSVGGFSTASLDYTGKSGSLTLQAPVGSPVCDVAF